MGQIFRFEIADDPNAQIIVAAARSDSGYSLTAFKQILIGGEYQTLDRCSESAADAKLIEEAQATVAAQLETDASTSDY